MGGASAFANGYHNQRTTEREIYLLAEGPKFGKNNAPKTQIFAISAEIPEPKRYSVVLYNIKRRSLHFISFIVPACVPLHRQGILERNGGRLYLQQKAGCHPYHSDPQGFRSQTAQALKASDSAFQWTSGGANGPAGLLAPLANFSSDPRVSAFCACFLLSFPGKGSGERGAEVKRAMASLLYECASQEKMEMLPAWIEIFR